MSSLLVDGISAIVSIQIKRRHDGFTDQYNRLFMVKMCMIFSAFIGFNYFNDDVACIIANGNSGNFDKFVASACWIQGFYVFDEMRNRLNESGYYGLPRNMDYDGINSIGQLCTTTDRASEHVHSCEPMKRVFYLQFQYMPFFTAALALLFYFPYIIYKLGNTDFISLKEAVNKEGTTTEDLFQSFFDHRINSKRRMRYRSVVNITVKVLYLVANVVAFILCDAILHNDFSSYGRDYMNWLKLENFQQNDHNLKERLEPKPGNILLPPMGYCDIHEATRDVRNTHINTHRFICEISPHVLYQYVMLVFWFLLVFGMVFSIIGIITHAISHFFSYRAIKQHDSSGVIYQHLTLREVDYLDYLRQKKLTHYDGVIKKIKECRGLGLLKDENKNAV